MTPKQIDAFCGRLPAATRSVQWDGVIVFKVGGKMFAVGRPSGTGALGEYTFKASEMAFELLVEDGDHTVFVVGFGTKLQQPEHPAPEGGRRSMNSRRRSCQTSVLAAQEPNREVAPFRAPSATS